MGGIVFAIVLQSLFDNSAFCLSYIAGSAFLVSTGYMIGDVMQALNLGFVFDCEF